MAFYKLVFSITNYYSISKKKLLKMSPFYIMNTIRITVLQIKTT